MKHLFFFLSLVSLLFITACAREGEIFYAQGSSFSEDSFATPVPLDVTEKEAGKESAGEGPASGGGTEGAGAGSAQAETGLHNEIFVAVMGEVNNPGIYVFSEPTRLFEVLNLAGGAGEAADLTGFDLVNIISEDCTIIIPRETGSSVAENTGGILRGGTSEPSGGSGTVGSGAKSSLVNINTAGRDELMTLSGIGATRADAIIAYREENGKFSKPEDLMKVAGIKEGTFGKLKDSITVD